MRFFNGHAFSIWYETPGDPGAGGGGAPAPPSPGPGSSTVPPPAPGPASVAPPAGTSGTPGAAPNGAPATRRYDYPEDRSNWFDPARVGQITARAQASELRNRQLEGMLRAGTGIELPRQPTAQDLERQEARAFIGQLFPEFEQVFKLLERKGDLDALLDRAPELTSGYEQVFTQRGTQTLDTLYGKVAEAYGVKVEELDRDTQEDVGNAFAAWVSRDEQRAQQYARGYGDKLVGEFMTGWTKRYIDPLRRVAQAPGAAAGRSNASLPAAPRSSAFVPGSTPPPPPANDDEVHERAMRSFMAAVNSR